MKKKIMLLAVIAVLGLAAQVALADTKRILYIDSYHPSYLWSEEITRGITAVLGRDKDVELRIFRMDTKRNKSEAFKKQAARSAAELIESWNPHVVIASDDNASKYLIVPYYRGKTRPFVFCGLNWDASLYGFPTRNITGMVETSPYPETIELLKRFSRGRRLGLIGENTYSSNKEVRYLKETLKLEDLQVRLASNFEEWKQAYLWFQENVDMLLSLTSIGIRDWDPPAAKAFILRHTKIPSGGISDNNIENTLLGRTNIAEEQG